MVNKINHARGLRDLDLAPSALCSNRVNIRVLSGFITRKTSNKQIREGIEKMIHKIKFFKRFVTIIPLFYPIKLFDWVDLYLLYSNTT